MSGRSTNYQAAQDTISTFKSAFVSLGPYQFCNLAGDVKVSEELSCSLEATGSNDSGGKSFTISVGHQVIVGNFSMTNTSTSLSGTFTGGPNTSKQILFTVTHDPTALFVAPARFIGRTTIGSSTLTVYGSPQETGIREIKP